MSDDVGISVGGERYTDTRPDTLDLAERARLAVHGIMGSIDPELLTMYGLVFYATPRPHQSHWASAETTCDPKFAESLVLLRAMCGSEDMTDLQARYFGALLGRVQDGLYWDLRNPLRPWRNSYSSAFYGAGKDEDFCCTAGAGRMMRTLMAWRALSGRDGFDGQIRDLVRGLLRVAVKKDDYAYYPEKGGWGEPCAYPRSGWLNTDEAEGETEGGEGSVVCFHGHQIYGAMQWHAATGDPTALELAARLSRYVMKPKFWGGVPGPAGEAITLGHIGAKLPDPPYTAGAELGHWFSHFHARAIALRGLLEYGRGAGDERVLEFVRRSYEFTLSQGIPRLGWINGYPGSKTADSRCESCSLGDWVALGIRLSDAGLGDYWDDVDACARNQLVEQQVTDAALLRRIAAASTAPSWEEKPDVPAGKLNYDDTIARTLGVFFGFGRPNAVSEPWVMHCCTSNASQGLYYAWEGAVRERGDTAEVNLLLNRASRLLDVRSHLPYEGRIELRNKGARRIRVRIPAWAGRRELRATVDGQPAELDWMGNGLVFCGLTGREAIALTFPVKESTATYTVAANTPREHAFTCTFRASTCVDIAPADTSPTSYPLYRRAHLRAGLAPLQRGESFVANRIDRDW
ncbi:MAG: glycoside hydrolase family 127 protein [Lentisphaerae bacterium]|nr:glycoside hydrolase family 127 protein [Lentisphaerota bacterium]